MPTLPIAHDASASPLERLVPREADAASLIARQPEIGYSADAPIAISALGKRQSQQSGQSGQSGHQIVEGIIPSYVNPSGPAGGTVVGIVLGSVVGFLLLVYLFWSIANGGAGNNGTGTNVVGEEEIVVRRPRRNSHSGRSRRSTRTEVRDMSRSPRRREQIIVEERRQPPPMRTRSRTRSIVVEERARVPGDDVVEVIEEHDDYRSRRGSRRSGGGYR